MKSRRVGDGVAVKIRRDDLAAAHAQRVVHIGRPGPVVIEGKLCGRRIIQAKPGQNRRKEAAGFERLNVRM